MPDLYTASGQITVRRTTSTPQLVAALRRNVESWENHNLIEFCRNSKHHLRLHIMVADYVSSDQAHEFQALLEAFQNDCVVAARFEEEWDGETGSFYVGTPAQIEKRLSVYHFEQIREHLMHLNPLHIKKLRKFLPQEPPTH